MAARVNPVIKSIAKAVQTYANSAKDPLTGKAGLDLATAYTQLSAGLANAEVRTNVLAALEAAK